MSPGKILVSNKKGIYLLKFRGDVRMTLCGTLNRHIETIFGSKDVRRVAVDMFDAEGLDSTTLGLVAKLGLYCRKHYGFDIEVFCKDPSILRTLESMSFHEIFNIFSQLPQINTGTELSEIGVETQSEEAARKQVIEAHRILMALSARNQHEFQDLIEVLESNG